MAATTKNDIRKVLPSYGPVTWVFVVLVWAALLVPLVGMLWAPSDTSAENREAAPEPQLLTESGNLNLEVLSDAGAYFADHYAYRNYLVDADARLFSGVFAISTADNVVYGEDGWLYYAGTLSDYQNREPLRQRQAANIAHNMRMLQDWCEAQGADFLFTIAPDKNALYGEDMPYYYPPVDNESMMRLDDALVAEGVDYLDLFEVMREAEGVQYFLRDSHWSDKGALLGHDAIAEAAGLATAGLVETDLVARDDYIGDLNRMLFPVSAVPETDWYATGVNDGLGATGTQRSGSYWDYVEGADPNDGIVVTAPSEADAFADVAARNGRMLMFRDSFAIGLLPFFACETAGAKFDKMVPYDGLQLLDEEYATVVVERAQRHVADLAETPFIMPCPAVDLPDVGGDSRAGVSVAAAVVASCKTESQGSLILLSGTVDDPLLQPNDDIYLQLVDADGVTRTYEAFRCTGDTNGADEAAGADNIDNAYAVYVSSSAWGGKDVGVRVLVGWDLNIEAQSAMIDVGILG